MGASAVTKITDTKIANIVFNETRSLSGAGIADARVNIAHAVINADAAGHLPAMAPGTAHPPAVEAAAYAACVMAAQKARANVNAGLDPTSGAQHFNFRKNNSQAAFQGHALKTTKGPLDNSYPTDDLPATGIYANTYE